MANVFISHRTDDKALAERLASEIRNAGHTVWFDDWEIKIGDSLIERINSGLAGATYLVLCYSSVGVGSPWMSREWMSALAARMNGANITLLPVNLSGGAAPLILQDLKYADLVKDWASGLADLLRSIR